MTMFYGKFMPLPVILTVLCTQRLHRVGRRLRRCLAGTYDMQRNARQVLQRLIWVIRASQHERAPYQRPISFPSLARLPSKISSLNHSPRPTLILRSNDIQRMGYPRLSEPLFKMSRALFFALITLRSGLKKASSRRLSTAVRLDDRRVSPNV